MISFNQEAQALMQQLEEQLTSDIADYMIVHELLHFFVPNHGKLWKSLMRAHLGDYENLDKRLRKGSAK
jgi:predicted metal-dependent hydrolase